MAILNKCDHEKLDEQRDSGTEPIPKAHKSTRLPRGSQRTLHQPFAAIPTTHSAMTELLVPVQFMSATALNLEPRLSSGTKRSTAGTLIAVAKLHPL